jgi:hypothetical protein
MATDHTLVLPSYLEQPSTCPILALKQLFFKMYLVAAVQELYEAVVCQLLVGTSVPVGSLQNHMVSYIDHKLYCRLNFFLVNLDSTKRVGWKCEQ